MVRLWSKTLQLTHNGIEHATWASSKMTHRRNGQQVEAVEPDLGNMPVSKYVDFITDRLACFIHKFSAHGLQQLMPQGINITEIPLAVRDPVMPDRFRVTLQIGGQPHWALAYHHERFEDAGYPFHSGNPYIWGLRSSHGK